MKNKPVINLLRSTIRKAPVLQRILGQAYRESRMILYLIRSNLPSALLGRYLRKSQFLRPKPLKWHVPLGIGFNHENLCAFFREHDIEFDEGGHSIYVPPQKKFAECFKEIVNFYPERSGFKILRNISRSDDTLYTLKTMPRVSWIQRMITGTAVDYAFSACLLDLLEIGPEFIDHAKIIDTLDGGILECFVVKHMPGQPTIDEYHTFINRLKSYTDRGLVSIIPAESFEHSDLLPPDCNKNLRKSESDSKVCYVDAQQFVFKSPELVVQETINNSVESLHFGDQIGVLHKRNFLYQDIPGLTRIGKRDTAKRWIAVRNLLDHAHMEVKDRLVLDIGCNSGMMLIHALADGAVWGIGWDKPEVADAAYKIQKGLGGFRFTCRGAMLSHEYDLMSDVPDRLNKYLDGCVIFYLSVWRHLGFINAIRNIPFSCIVFEGHEGESFDNDQTWLDPALTLWNCQMHSYSTIRDGTCSSRPLGILLPN